MTADGLPALDTNAPTRPCAIAGACSWRSRAGVVRHLQNNRSAIKVFCEDNETKPVTVVDVDYG